METQTYLLITGFILSPVLLMFVFPKREVESKYLDYFNLDVMEEKGAMFKNGILFPFSFKLERPYQAKHKRMVTNFDPYNDPNRVIVDTKRNQNNGENDHLVPVLECEFGPDIHTLDLGETKHGVTLKKVSDGRAILDVDGKAIIASPNEPFTLHQVRYEMQCREDHILIRPAPRIDTFNVKGCIATKDLKASV